MAEGGSSVDFGEVKLCDICDEGGNKVNATNYCLQCEQYLCMDCRSYHSRVKATRSHELSGTDNIPKVSSATSISELRETYICKKHERKLEFFCKTHKVALCLACRRIEHKECSKVEGIQNAAQEIFSNNHGIKILKSLKDLADGFADCKAAAETIKDKLPEKKARAVESVKKARKVADQYLDKIEAYAYHELDSIYKEETTSLEEKVHICAASESFLQKRVNSLEKIVSIGEKEKEFIEINKATKETKQYCITLRELYQEVFEKQLTFQHNSNLIKLNEWLNDLGQCCQDKLSVAAPFHGLVAIYTGEMEVKTKTDKDEPAISSYNELPDGRKLLVDWKNKKVKMFDDQNIFVSETVFTDDIPWSLVLPSSSTAVVSLLNDTCMARYVNITNVVTCGNITGLNFFASPTYDYWSYRPKLLGMDKCEEEILGIFESQKDKFYLAISVEGRSKDNSVFNYKKGSLSKPRYVAFSATQMIAYVLDLDIGCVGLNIKNGKNVFRYCEKYIKEYSGLAAGSDCVFIGTGTGLRECFKTLKFKLSGEVDILPFSNSQPLRVIGNKIVLFTVENNGDRVVNFCSLMR